MHTSTHHFNNELDNLPNELIHYILSFLSSKEIVQFGRTNNSNSGLIDWVQLSSDKNNQLILKGDMTTTAKVRALFQQKQKMIVEAEQNVKKYNALSNMYSAPKSLYSVFFEKPCQRPFLVFTIVLFAFTFVQVSKYQSDFIDLMLGKSEFGHFLKSLFVGLNEIFSFIVFGLILSLYNSEKEKNALMQLEEAKKTHLQQMTDKKEMIAAVDDLHGLNRMTNLQC